MIELDTWLFTVAQKKVNHLKMLKAVAIAVAGVVTRSLL